MSNSVKEVVAKNLAPIISEMGYVLVDVEYSKKPNGMNLSLFIDGDNGVDLEALEKIHRVVDVKLDELDPTNGAPYILNCTSLGLDRPIKTEYEFNKYREKEVDVKFYEPLKPYNKKELTCTLKSLLNRSKSSSDNLFFEAKSNSLSFFARIELISDCILCLVLAIDVVLPLSL